MIRKILSIMLISIMCLSVFNSSIVLAALDGDYYETYESKPKTDTSTPDGIITGANDFISEGESQVSRGEALNTKNLVDTSNFIYNLLLAIAMIMAMAVGIAIGIKFMMASATEKAEVKELLWPYVLGCIVVFGAMGIWKLAVTVFSRF